MSVTVGYLFRGEPYCPSDIAAALSTGPDEAFDGWDNLIPIGAEENLSEIAIAFGFDRDDEDSFSSWDFPFRISEQIAHLLGHVCASCQRPLVYAEGGE